MYCDERMSMTGSENIDTSLLVLPFKNSLLQKCYSILNLQIVAEQEFWTGFLRRCWRSFFSSVQRLRTPQCSSWLPAFSIAVVCMKLKSELISEEIIEWETDWKSQAILEIFWANRIIFLLNILLNIQILWISPCLWELSSWVFSCFIQTLCTFGEQSVRNIALPAPTLHVFSDLQRSPALTMWWDIY